MAHDEKPLRILMLIHRLPDASPYCVFVHEQAKALAARGHDVLVLSPVPWLPMEKRLRPAYAEVDARTPDRAVIDGIPVYFPRFLTLGNRGEAWLGGRLMAQAALPTARRLHDEKPFDVIHAHMLTREGHAARILAKKLGIPAAVLTVHGTDVLTGFPARGPLRRRSIATAQRIDALMAVSQMLLLRTAPYRSKTALSRVVLNGVDLRLIPEQIEKKPFSILSVGTLKPRKCMDRTLEAFFRIADAFPAAALTIIGVGDMEESLRKTIAQSPHGDRVRLIAGLPHEEVIREMAKSDLFVLPSWGEGYGVVYIEAMACGCLTIGARDEGIDGTIIDGQNGYLIPAGDTDAETALLRKLLASRDQLAPVRDRAMQTARALTWARNAQETEKVYREALSLKAKA